MRPIPPVAVPVPDAVAWRRRRRPGSILKAWAVVLACWGGHPLAWAESPSPSELALPEIQAITPGTDAFVRSLLLTLLPREYENTKQWGKTKPRWDGLHISLDDWRLDTKRRWKEVNHGTWTRYKATLIDPERQLHLRTSNLRQTERQTVSFDLVADLRLALTGRLSEWRHGVQLYSFSADADARLTLALTCEAGLAFDTSKFPPDIKLAPRVTQAQIDLLEFELHRISDADGPIVRKLGDGLKNVLQDELQDRRPKLVEKMNKSLDKQAGKLRLSLHDLTANGLTANGLTASGLTASGLTASGLAPPSK